MKRFALCICFGFVFLLACGTTKDPTVNVTSNVDVPLISNLQYSPKSASSGDGGGAVTINGNFDFIDLNNNITTLKISRDSSGEESTETLQGIEGVQSGIIKFSLSIPTGNPGTFNFNVWVIDKTGNTSNRLKGSFEVIQVTE